MRRDATGRVTSTIVAVVSVVVLAVALVGFLVDGSGDDTPAAAEQQAASETTAESASKTSSGSTDETSAAEATGGEKSPRPSEKTKPDDKQQKKPGKPKKKQQAEPDPEPAVPSVYVEVYNMTSVNGLASSKAAQLQDAGWQVVGIDNWRGNIPASTVYYPDGMADEATQLANSLGIGRTRGAVAPMKFDRLTVILTSDAV
jgi:hypothetical protein